MIYIYLQTWPKLANFKRSKCWILCFFMQFFSKKTTFCKKVSAFVKEK
jgi:hypothetical protein